LQTSRRAINVLNTHAEQQDMKALATVTQVELIQFHYEVPNADRDPRTGKLMYKIGATAKMPTFAVRLVSDRGVGEYVAHMGGRPSIFAQVLSVAKGMVGEKIGAGASFNAFANKQLQTLGRLGVGALDIAMWDLLGKSLGVSVSDLIGLSRRELPAYASLIHGHRDGDLATNEDLVDAAVGCVAVGLQGIKFRGWPGDSASSYARTIKVVADAVPDRQAINLFLDPGCDLTTFGNALYVGRAADDAGLYWLEDMFRDSGNSSCAHKRLRERVSTPLLCGEHVRGLEAKADWIASGATDFIRADPELDGGITGCLKIAHLAEAFGMDVEFHGSGPAHRITMAAVRNSNFYELGLVLPDGTNIHAPPVYSSNYSDGYSGLNAQGYVHTPDGPGLGVTYDWDKIRNLQTDRVMLA
jgi:L-alanine-DL-glutamate epimerase-like enolase superfamily enzyme